MTSTPSRILPALAAGVPAAAALALLPLGQATALAAGAAVLPLLVLAPAASTATVAFAVPFGDTLRVPVGGLAVTGVELALGTSAGVWWLRGCAARDLGIRRHPVWAAVGLVALSVVASMPQATALDLAVKELAKWASFALALALGMALAREPRAAALVVGAMLLAGTLEAARGLNQAVSGVGPLGFLLGGSYLRAFGSFGQPNPFAAYLATGVVLAAGLLLAQSARGVRALVAPAPALVAAAAVVMTVGLLASLSRSALLALLAGLAVMAVTYRPRVVAFAPALLAAAAALWLLGGFGLLPEFLVVRLTTIFESFTLLDPREVLLTGTNFAVVQRMAIWEAAGGMFADNPWFGVGAGNFDLAYPLYALPNWPQAPGHAHNYYLNLLAETGLVGLAAYLALLATLGLGALAAARRAVRLQQAAPHAGLEGRVGLALAAVGIGAVLTVHHVFDNLYVHGIGAQIGLLVGLALGGAPLDHAAETPAS